MRPGAAIVVLVTVACAVAASSSCLLAVDFDDYGTGGASSATSGGPATTTGAGGSDGSGGAGGGEALEPCPDGAANYFVLPEEWDEVRVAPSGSGFVAAPESDLFYVSMAADEDPSIRTRASEAKPLFGLLSLSDTNALLRGFAVVPGGDGSVIVALAGKAEGSVSGVFRHDHADSTFSGSILSSISESGFALPKITVLSRATGTLFTGSIRLLESEDTFLGIGANVVFVAHTLVLDDNLAPERAAIVANAGPDAMLGDASVDEGAIIVTFQSTESDRFRVTSEAASLAERLTSADDVEGSPGSAAWIVSGVDAEGGAALIRTPDVAIATAGAIVDGWPSRLAPGRWLATVSDGGPPRIRLYDTAETADEMLALAGVSGYDLASTTREGRVVTLASLVVGDADVMAGECLLPRGRRVLVELNGGAP